MMIKELMSTHLNVRNFKCVKLCLRECVTSYYGTANMGFICVCLVCVKEIDYISVCVRVALLSLALWLCPMSL